ncbi:MAG TPA: class I SAM-dependent methyltransferase [Anaerolineae bacterium]|nr:class I SAM-dependent methyltransferase [Anaerolineae bacterium]
MFTETAAYYDKIYSFKDYAAEARQVIQIVDTHAGPAATRLLDVACGTGHHLSHLKQRFHVEGLDLSEALLAQARERLPGVKFHHADMVAFDLGRTFDVITCLFSSIGYVETLERLDAAIASMARHLAPGGLLLVEPWFTPEGWHPNTVHSVFVDEPEFRMARINTSFQDSRISYFDLHYLIGTPNKTEHFVEHHRLGLFTREETEAAFRQAGLDVTYDEQGLTGRGLYTGRRPA